jgi:hypothetical protein
LDRLQRHGIPPAAYGPTRQLCRGKYRLALETVRQRCDQSIAHGADIEKFDDRLSARHSLRPPQADDLFDEIAAADGDAAAHNVLENAEALEQREILKSAGDTELRQTLGRHLIETLSSISTSPPSSSGASSLKR